MEKKCTFSEHRLRIPIDERLDFSSTLEDSIIQLRKEVPQELVVTMFQKLVSFRPFTRYLRHFDNVSHPVESTPNPVHACGKVDRAGY